MASSLLVLTLAAGLLTGAAPTQAQPSSSNPKSSAPAGTADPVKLLEQSRAALSQVDAMSYKATVTSGGGLEAPEVKSDVSMAKAEAGGWRIYAKGVSGSNLFEVAYDGASAQSLSEKNKSVYQKTPKDQSDLMVFFSGQSAKHPIAWELINEDKALPVSSAAPVHQGQETVEGVKCDIVFVPPADKDNSAPDADHGYRVFIATTDHLPRRIERLVGVAGAQSRILTLGQFRTNRDSIGAPYTLSVPDGYAIRAADSVKKTPRGAKGIGGGPDQQQPKRAQGPNEGDMVPDFKLKDANGKEHKLSDYRGKVVVLDFWATWCPPCLAAMPGIQRLHEKFQGQPVEVIGVAFAERGDPVAHMQKKKYTYGLLLNGEVLNDSYGIGGTIPTFFVIGKDGKLLWRATGGTKHDEHMAEVIQKELDRE